MPTNNQKIEKLYYELVEKYISFETISTLKSSADEMIKCVNWLDSLLTKYGFEVNIVNGYLNPIIIAKYDAGKTKTALAYGHYDVQPAKQIDGWQQSPFTVNDNGDTLFARGIADNKGQFLIHLATILTLVKNETLKYNVTFLIEGNEETGSPKIEQFVKDYKKELESDFVLISDGSLTQNKPTIEVSLRGATSFTISLKTAKNELHSGIYGGAVANAALELAKLLTKLVDNNQNILIPNFYDGIDVFCKQSKSKLIKENGKESIDAGVTKLLLKPNENFYSAVGLNPTLQITGMQSGFVGDGYKNSIPNTATAKINLRTVGNQDTYKLAILVKEYLELVAPQYVKITFEDISKSNCADPVVIDLSSEIVQKSIDILKQVYTGELIYEYVGGSIPLVKFLQREISENILLIPLVNAGCNMHGVDENFKKEYILKGIEFSKLFFSET